MLFYLFLYLNFSFVATDLWLIIIFLFLLLQLVTIVYWHSLIELIYTLAINFLIIKTILLLCDHYFYLYPSINSFVFSIPVFESLLIYFLILKAHSQLYLFLDKSLLIHSNSSKNYTIYAIFIWNLS